MSELNQNNTSVIVQTSDLKNVKDHYQDYPYPYRNPEEEKTRLLALMGEYLGELNHYLYKGKESFKKNFRILIAGGGTGDSSTYMGEQLKDTECEIVYLDFSKASMEIAQKRAEIRGIKNIKWINDSILNIPKLKLGKFDYINCSGVLHHLASPDAGLKILQESLTDRGGMSVMVYGKYGRTGVYQIQEIMKMVNEGVDSRAEEVMNGKTIINSLPETNWYVRGKELLYDHLIYGDIGLYDMFLHKQDRAYSIPELYKFIEDAGLHFVDFFDANERLRLRIENYITDFSLLERIRAMDQSKQQAICEILIGTIIKHSVYLTKEKTSPKATLDDLNNIPYFYGVAGVPQLICDHLKSNTMPVGSSITLTLNNVVLQNVNITIPISQFTHSIFHNMIGETKSLREIFDAVKKELKQDIKDEELIAECKNIFSPFFATSMMLLRDKSLARF
ncbi:MAG UNVERIFIED_CONTAM: class I SAM-dependent methyltransferase [Rickettsiaceae bacterium]|jgi:ubiquinone/menaquinone biosynthesis C-methylase UbiE